MEPKAGEAISHAREILRAFGTELLNVNGKTLFLCFNVKQEQQ